MTQICKQLTAVSILPFFFLLCSCGQKGLIYETDSFLIELNGSGKVINLKDKYRNVNYLPPGETSPLVAIRINGAYENPASMTWDESTNLLTLSYPESKSTLSLQVTQKEKYITFEITDAQFEKDIELALWGPYATTISQIVGECVGVVRDENYAIGIQALNPKTIGGYPTTEDDIDPSYDIFATSSLVDVADSLNVLYRGQTAKHTSFGSVIQAYCRNRDKERVISMWGHDHYTVPAYDDGGVSGSKIALFGCPANEALDYIEVIEKGENLPHPEMNGVWMKRAPEAAQAYIIYPFNENNIDEAIAFTKQTGLKYLYHGGPFETWGKFKLNPKEFPTGLDGLKKCVDRAAQSGIKIGIHTLSNFITTNDGYVTPVPDKGLAKVGSSVLSNDIDSRQTEIEIADPMFFNQMKNNSLHTVIVGEELIRYERVSDASPWKLLNCTRGAWGTKAAAHRQGTEIGKLIDHPYNVFLSDIDLTKGIAHNIADIFNQTGIDQISFDGLEGAWSTGLGQYGLSLMIKEWYDHLEPAYRNNINDASMTTHYNWHTFTRMNWGEPWYAGFRESQMNYRLMNQDFYRRNLMPCMLGWFKLDANTSIEDIEWLLARTAAFDAGYTLVTDKEKIIANGQSEVIIKAIREWEKARLSGAFPMELKKEMEQIDNEYTLTQTGDNSWDLFPYHLQRFKHANVVRQPGEPVVTHWDFTNPYQRQPVRFTLKTNDAVSNITLKIANYSTVEIKETLKKGDYIKYDGESEIVLYDKNWVAKRRIAVDKQKMMIPEGEGRITFACDFATKEDPELNVSAEVKTIGQAISLKSTR